MFRNTTKSSETFGFDTNFEHYFTSQPYDQPERVYEVLGQGPEHSETRHPGMTKALPMGEDGKFEEEPKDPGYSALLIHKEQWDLLNKHIKMLATPRYQTLREINTDPTNLENIETDIKNTIAKALSPEMTCNESKHWSIGERNPQSDDSAKNITSSRKTTGNQLERHQAGKHDRTGTVWVEQGPVLRR